MVLKRRSLSTCTNIYVNHKLSTATAYSCNADDSSQLQESSKNELLGLDSVKKQKMFLKKVNWRKFNKKKNEPELKKSSSTSDVAAFERSGQHRESFILSQKRPVSDSTGTCAFLTERANNIHHLYASFSFGGASESKNFCVKKNPNHASQSVYRCVLYLSNPLSSTEWILFGTSETISLNLLEKTGQFSFVKPFDVIHHPKSRTILKWELQRMTPEKCVSRSQTADPSSSLHISVNYATIATVTSDLNSLINRGFLSTMMNMRCQQSPVFSIYIGSEQMDKESATLVDFNLKFNVKQRVDENNVKVFTTDAVYRLLVSKYFEKAEAFVPVFKSRLFGLKWISPFYQVDIDLNMSQHHFDKIDNILRFALIEGSSEQCLCFGDIRGVLLFNSDIEIPIKEANFNNLFEMRNQQPVVSSSNYKQLIQKFWMKVRRNSDSKSTEDDVDVDLHTSYRSHQTPAASPSHLISRNHSLTDRPRTSQFMHSKHPLARAESAREPYNRHSNTSTSSSTSSSGYSEDEIADDVMIVNGHTQAYIMSMLMPDRKILVREVYPDHVNICEYIP